jgi:hypothetical protein
MIKLDQPVGTDGLTIQDLIVTLMKELAKNNLLCAGVILDINDPGKSRIFGHGNEQAMAAMLEIGVKGLLKGTIADLQRFTGGGN